MRGGGGERVREGESEGGGGGGERVRGGNEALTCLPKVFIRQYQYGQTCELLQLGTVPHVFILHLHDIVTYKIMNRPSPSVYLHAIGNHRLDTR